MSPQDFGEKLRLHRERRGVGLQTIAGITKINRHLLAALERGDCSRWPVGLYSRAYVRSYAAVVDLDTEELVAEFARCFPQVAWPDGPPQAEPPPAPPPSGFEPRAGRVTGRRLAGDTI